MGEPACKGVGDGICCDLFESAGLGTVASPSELRLGGEAVCRTMSGEAQGGVELARCVNADACARVEVVRAEQNEIVLARGEGAKGT